LSERRCRSDIAAPVTLVDGLSVSRFALAAWLDIISLGHYQSARREHCVIENLATALNGVLLPLPTPFSADESIDEAALRQNIHRWSTTGISGYVMLGSTGERVHLNEREYAAVIEISRDAVSSQQAFIVGAGQQSVRATNAEVKLAAAAGADAVLVITPSFYRPAITQEALFNFYTAVADAASIPVMLYSMPALTGIKIEPSTVARLSHHPNIIGIKDSSNDIAGLNETINSVRGADRESSPAKFMILTGNGTVFCDALGAGADGAILAVGCVAPELCVEIRQAVKAGDIARAKMLQERLTPLAAAVTTKYGIGGLKAALDLCGYRGGRVRAPLRAPDDAARDEISRWLNEARAELAGR